MKGADFILISDQLVYVVKYGNTNVVSKDTVLKRMEFDFELEMHKENTHLNTIRITEGHAKVNY